MAKPKTVLDYDSLLQELCEKTSFAVALKFLKAVKAEASYPDDTTYESDFSDTFETEELFEKYEGQFGSLVWFHNCFYRIMTNNEGVSVVFYGSGGTYQGQWDYDYHIKGWLNVETEFEYLEQ